MSTPLPPTLVDQLGALGPSGLRRASRSAASTLEEVLTSRRGVCQDFAHAAVAAVRSLGLAARYVSDYLRTASTPVAEEASALETRPTGELIGSAASHAWLSVLVPGTGWVDIDPTNRTVVDQRFVTTAWGRDYSDVPPLKGIVVGPRGSAGTLDVRVGVVPVVDGEGAAAASRADGAAGADGAVGRDTAPSDTDG